MHSVTSLAWVNDRDVALPQLVKLVERIRLNPARIQRQAKNICILVA
jgi:hypothetical protein